MLYIVPTPIGNLKDITLRSLDVLKSVDLILCEDTRTSGILLKHYDIHKPLISYHQHNEHKIVEDLVLQISNKDVALITDAGTPGISDPGYLLINACIDKNIEIQCLPGATAFVPALINSGLPGNTFVFEGFLPQKKGRHTKLELLAEEKRTMIFYESPFRLVKTLTDFSAYFGPMRRCAVSREISKLYEETKRGTLEELINHFKEKKVKGEIVIILSGAQ